MDNKIRQCLLLFKSLILQSVQSFYKPTPAKIIILLNQLSNITPAIDPGAGFLSFAILFRRTDLANPILLLCQDFYFIGTTTVVSLIFRLESLKYSCYPRGSLCLKMFTREIFLPIQNFTSQVPIYIPVGHLQEVNIGHSLLSRLHFTCNCFWSFQIKWLGLMCVNYRTQDFINIE